MNLMLVSRWMEYRSLGNRRRWIWMLWLWPAERANTQFVYSVPVSADWDYAYVDNCYGDG